MADPLPRRKPDPIPSVHPVPEHLATGSLAAVYEDTRTVLGVPWMGVVTMAFAHYPTFYGELWRGMRAIASTPEFTAACADLRSTAEAQARRFEPAALRPDLLQLGYTDPELAQVEDLIEVFSHGNMPYILIATAARLLLEGQELPSRQSARADEERPAAQSPARLLLMEPHHADAPTRAVYDEIKTALGLPFVNTDYRALARWPSYFRCAWAALKPLVREPSYETAVAQVHAKAVDLLRALPNPAGLRGDAVREAAAKDADVNEIAEVVRLFQWLLPGLALNVAIFREQLS